jgi:hypothetical protein
MRGLKRTGPRASWPPGTPSSRTAAAHYETATGTPARHRLRTAFDDLTMAI